MDALAERILSDISAVFKRDPQIEEFDVVPVDEAQNKSPVLHVGHRVALQSWCVQHLYHYCYDKLFEWRERRRKGDPDVVLRWSVAVLLLNPDIQTVWNIRKEMIVAGHLKANVDLRFSFIVLTRKPKSPEVFAHRKWLLVYLSKCRDDSVYMVDHDEMAVCLSAASRYPNNYHAWSHRTWVMQQLKLSHEVLSKELTTNEAWMSTHISDHSGMQYRQFLIDALVALHAEHIPERENSSSEDDSNHSHDVHSSNGKSVETDRTVPLPSQDDAQTTTPPGALRSIADLLASELALLSELILLYPGHEALWYHRRYLVHAFRVNGLFSDKNAVTSIPTAHLKNALSIGPSRKKTKLEAANCVPNHQVLSMEKELAFVEHCYAQNEDEEEKAVQANLASRHKRWLNSCLLVFDAPKLA